MPPPGDHGGWRGPTAHTGESGLTLSRGSRGRPARDGQSIMDGVKLSEGDLIAEIVDGVPRTDLEWVTRYTRTSG